MFMQLDSDDPRVDQFQHLLDSAESCYRDVQDARDRLEALRTDLLTVVEDLADQEVINEDSAAAVHDAVRAGQFRLARTEMVAALEEGSA